jgi:hypothetical protein
MELLKEEEEIEAATLMRSMACVAAERGVNQLVRA